MYFQKDYQGNQLLLLASQSEIQFKVLGYDIYI